MEYDDHSQSEQRIESEACQPDAEKRQQDQSANLDASIDSNWSTPASHIPSKVVILSDYLEHRVLTVKNELQRVERHKGRLMNRLIHEKDHSLARKLQQEIGRLDERHAKLNDHLKVDELRYQSYTAASS